jgi:D-alanyl-D-alanine carboxypeptidase
MTKYLLTVTERPLPSERPQTTAHVLAGHVQLMPAYVRTMAPSAALPVPTASKASAVVRPSRRARSSRIFVPAGLKATSFDTEPRISGQHAHGYELLGKPPLADVSVLSPSHGWAAGALVSNASDLARFYRALYRGQLVSPALVKQMQTTVPMAPRLTSSGYGLGLFKLPMRCGTAFGHPGAIPGFLADAWSSKDGSREAVLLVNIGEHSRTAKASAALRHALETAYCLNTSRR